MFLPFPRHGWSCRLQFQQTPAARDQDALCSCWHDALVLNPRRHHRQCLRWLAYRRECACRFIRPHRSSRSRCHCDFGTDRCNFPNSDLGSTTAVPVEPNLHFTVLFCECVACFSLQVNEAAAIAAWKSLRDCAELTLETLSDPKQSVAMPWPSIWHPQGDRMEVSETAQTLRIDGREFFGDLYRHAITERKIPRVNVVGTNGVGVSHRLAALAGLLLKQVSFLHSRLDCC